MSVGKIGGPHQPDPPPETSRAPRQLNEPSALRLQPEVDEREEATIILGEWIALQADPGDAQKIAERVLLDPTSPAVILALSYLTAELRGRVEVAMREKNEEGGMNAVEQASGLFSQRVYAGLGDERGRGQSAPDEKSGEDDHAKKE